MSEKSRLILIEGIPGSGKTTFAERLNKHLLDSGKSTKIFREGDRHPADLAWHALLTHDEFEGLTKKHSELEEILRQNAIIDADSVLVPYLTLGFRMDENELMRYLQQKEIFDGKLSAEQFQSLYLSRWRSFAQNAQDSDDIFIFECVYMQNQINELLLFDNCGAQDMASYLKELAETVEGLNPVLVYLTQPNAKETIRRVAKERVFEDENGRFSWIDMVAGYIENTPYAKKHGLKGTEGMLEYFSLRRDLELDIVEKLPVESMVVETQGYDFDTAFEKMIAGLGEFI